MMLSMASTKPLIFSSVSMISMTMGRSCDRRTNLGGVEHARVSEAERSAQHCGPGEMHLARFQHDGLVERLVIGLVILADKDAQQHGVTGKLHRQIHFKELIEAASTKPNHTATRQATTETAMLAPASHHSPSWTRLRVWRLKDEKVV